jgi:hypothetical protein
VTETIAAEPIPPLSDIYVRTVKLTRSGEK